MINSHWSKCWQAVLTLTGANTPWRLLVNRSSVSLKAVLLGGAAIPVELTEQAREQGSAALWLWSDRVCLHGVCERSRRPGRRWLAAAGSEVKIVNNEVGCVCQRQKVTGVTGNWFHWLIY